MSVDIYLVVPTKTEARTQRLIKEHPDLGDAPNQVGNDFIALLMLERFDDVRREPEHWGPEYVAELPAWIRRDLDPRGLLACPAIGQSMRERCYADVASEAGSLWLPIKRPRASQKRLILVALSETRQARLLREPDLVRGLVDARATRTIPGSIEFDDIWIELQKLLLDFMWQSGGDESRAEALTPRRGLPLFEDKRVDSARFVPAEKARWVAEWMAGLPMNVVEQVRNAASPSPSSLDFPENLGRAEADDHEPRRPSARRVSRTATDPNRLGLELQRLQSFYAEVASATKAVLSIRFRA